MVPDIQRVQSTWEDKFNAQVAVVDEMVAAMNASEKAEWLTKYSNLQAEESHQAWKELCIYLFTKYLDGQQRKEKDGQFLRNEYGEPASPNRPAYPTEFLQTVKSQIAHE